MFHLWKFIKHYFFAFLFWRFSQIFFFRVVDVGSEWRTFSNEANGTDRSRVGGGEVIYVIRFWSHFFMLFKLFKCVTFNYVWYQCVFFKGFWNIKRLQLNYLYTKNKIPNLKVENKEKQEKRRRKQRLYSEEESFFSKYSPVYMDYEA